MAPGIGHLHLQAVAETPIQLRLQSVVNRSAIRQECCNETSGKPGIGISRNEESTVSTVSIVEYIKDASWSIQRRRQRIQLRLRRCRDVGREEEAWSNHVLHVGPVLRVQVYAVGSNVPYFGRVVLREHMFHADVPTHRVGILLVRRG